MSNVLNGSRPQQALALASDAAQTLRSGIGHAVTAIGTGLSLASLGQTGREVVKAARRNPATTAAAVTAAVGAGFALWALRRSQRPAADGKGPVEVEPIRVEKAPSRRNAAARKTTTARKRSTRSSEPRPTAH